MKIIVYYKHLNDSILAVLLKLLGLTQNYNVTVIIPLCCKAEFIERLPGYVNNIVFCDGNFTDCNFVFTLGGDGTFLEGLKLYFEHNIPVLGINTGRLGFLADILPNDIEYAIKCLINNEYIIEQRSIIEPEIIPNQKADKLFALNEITVHKRDTSSMIVINVYIDDNFLNTYWADGLIIATPTGSTAYSMSSGGPIIAPDANVFVLTPIASHNLTVRPLVITNSHLITLKVESRDRNYLFSVDSHSMPLAQPVEIRIKPGNTPARLIKLKDYCYYDTIRKKLLWGIDKRN